MRAASDSSRTSAARSRTTSWRRASRFCSTSSIAARAAAIPSRVTAQGSSSQIPDAVPATGAARRAASSCRRTERYAVGMVFLAQDPTAAARQAAIFERVVEREGQALLGWRDVPHDPNAIGRLAQAGLPRIRQIFVAARGREAEDADAFERRLYLIRRLVEREAGAESGGRHFFYVPSFSCRTIAYVGMLISTQIPRFFPDVMDPDFTSAMCLVHSRYSTNTFGAWDLAHPFRYLAHNGEINTIRGNQNWMHAREGTMASLAVRRRPEAALSDRPRGRERLGALRQRARVPRADGSRAARSDADDDPGGVGEPGRHGSRPARLLRVPLVPDGAVGRSGLDGLHRRPEDRRGARPQRPAPVALHGDQGRLRGDGIRGRRARHPARERPDQGAPAPRQDLPRGSRAGPHPRGRRDQAPLRRAPAVSRLGGAPTAAAQEPARGRSARRAGEPGAALPAPAGVRLHERGPPDPARADGRAGQVAARLDGRGRGARLPLGAAAAPLSLLQAALRAGHQPADGLDQRAAGDVAVLDARRRGQPARRQRGARADPAPRASRAHQRRAREAPADGSPGLPRADLPLPVQGQRERPGPRRRAGPALQPRRRRPYARA